MSERISWERAIGIWLIVISFGCGMFTARASVSYQHAQAHQLGMKRYFERKELEDGQSDQANPRETTRADTFAPAKESGEEKDNS